MKLEIGYNTTYEVRQEVYNYETISEFTMMYLSDLHLNRYSKPLIEALKKSIENLNPTFIFLGGDYVDGIKGLVYFEELLSYLSTRAFVFAIPGNHDEFFGINVIRDKVVKNNVVWLDKSGYDLRFKDQNIRITNVIKEKQKEAFFNILLIHKPIDKSGVGDHTNLIFAGHLHGCQVVFWQKEEALYPGRLFYKNNVLKQKVGKCLYLVSKGLGDTLPVRYNCKKEILFVSVKPK